MGEVVPFYEADSALVLNKLGVQYCNLRRKPFISLHARQSVRSEEPQPTRGGPVEKEHGGSRQVILVNTRDVPKVMRNFFFNANWEQQTKESAVVDGTSCCVILECVVTSIAYITWPVSLLTKWPTTICRFASVLSSNSL